MVLVYVCHTGNTRGSWYSEYNRESHDASDAHPIIVHVTSAAGEDSRRAAHVLIIVVAIMIKVLFLPRYTCLDVWEDYRMIKRLFLKLQPRQTLEKNEK